MNETHNWPTNKKARQRYSTPDCVVEAPVPDAVRFDVSGDVDDAGQKLLDCRFCGVGDRISNRDR